MPSFTIRFAVDVEADNAWDAVNRAEEFVNRLDEFADEFGLALRTDLVTDENGEEITASQLRASGLVGQTFTDDSHPEEPVFTVVSYDGDVLDLDNGQWYTVGGEEGILAKLDSGVIREI